MDINYYVVQDYLKKYDKVKGIKRFLFGDHEAIKILRNHFTNISKSGYYYMNVDDIKNLSEILIQYKFKPNDKKASFYIFRKLKNLCSNFLYNRCKELSFNFELLPEDNKNKSYLELSESYTFLIKTFSHEEAKKELKILHKKYPLLQQKDTTLIQESNSIQPTKSRRIEIKPRKRSSNFIIDNSHEKKDKRCLRLLRHDYNDIIKSYNDLIIIHNHNVRVSKNISLNIVNHNDRYYEKKRVCIDKTNITEILVKNKKNQINKIKKELEDAETSFKNRYGYCL